jgi:hypothetical protein
MTTSEQIHRLDKQINALLRKEERLQNSVLAMHRSALDRVNRQLEELLFYKLHLTTRQDSGTYELVETPAPKGWDSVNG